MLRRFSEELLYPAVVSGVLRVDQDGSIWRLGQIRGNRWNNEKTFVPCQPRRAEHMGRDYYQVRVMVDYDRFNVAAHRIVWRHFSGPIPNGLTINHKDGDKLNNNPTNLELATYSEQTMHALHVLRRGRVDQNGQRNAMAKLSASQVREIRARRVAGEFLTQIAKDYGISMQHVSKIARGETRLLG